MKGFQEIIDKSVVPQLAGIGLSNAEIKEALDFALSGIVNDSKPTSLHESIDLDSITKAEARNIKYAFTFNIIDTIEKIGVFIFTLNGVKEQPWACLFAYFILLKEFTELTSITLSENTCKVAYIIFRLWTAPVSSIIKFL